MRSKNPRVLPVLSEEIHWKKTMLIPQSTGSIHGEEPPRLDLEIVV